MATWSDYSTYFPSGLGQMVNDLETHVSGSYSTFNDFALVSVKQIQTDVTVEEAGTDYIGSLSVWIEGLKSGNDSFQDILDDITNSSFPEDHEYLQELFTLPGDWNDFNNNWSHSVIASEIANNATSDFWQAFANMLFTRRNKMFDIPFISFFGNFDERIPGQESQPGDVDLNDDIVDGQTLEEIRQYLHFLLISGELSDVRELRPFLDASWREMIENHGDVNAFTYTIAYHINSTANAYYTEYPSASLGDFERVYNPARGKKINTLYELLGVSNLTELKDLSIDNIALELRIDTTTKDVVRDQYFAELFEYFAQVLEYNLNLLMVAYSALLQIKDGFGNELDQFKVDLLDDNIYPGNPFLLTSGITTGEGFVQLNFLLLEEVETTYSLDLKIYNKRNVEVPGSYSIEFDPETTEVYPVAVTYFGEPPPTIELDLLLTEFPHSSELTGEAYDALNPFLTSLRTAETTLRDIRLAGGLREVEGFPTSSYNSLESGEKTEFDNYVNRIDSHANLELLSNDFEALETIIDDSTSDNYIVNIITIANTDRQKFVNDNYQNDGLDEFKCADLHVKAVAIKKFLDNMLGAAYASRGMKINVDPDPLLPDLPESTGIRDSESAVSPLAYLSELMNYAINHIYEYNDSTHVITPINIGFLEENFHQPFSDLPTSGDEMDNIICQSRVNVEVLNSFVDVGGLPANQAEQFNESYRRYLVATYLLILEKIGTSYQELRNSRNFSDEDKIKYAEKIGISLDLEESQLDEMLFDLDTISDTDLNTELESVFGFRKYDRPAIGSGSEQPTPLIETWRLNFLRDLWYRLDYPSDPFTDNEIPIIDPDIVTPDDFRDPFPSDGTGHNDNIFDLWIKRRQWVDSILDGLRTKVKNAGIFSELRAVVLYEQNRITEFSTLIGKEDAFRIDSIDYTLAILKMVGKDTVMIFEENLDGSLTIGDTLYADKILYVKEVRDAGGSSFTLIDVVGEDISDEFDNGMTFTYTDPTNTDHSCTVSTAGYSGDTMTITVTSSLPSIYTGGSLTYKKPITTIEGKSVQDIGAMFTHMKTGSNFTYNSDSYSPWDPSKDETDFKGIMAGLQSRNSVSVESALADLDLFNLSQEEFSRLYEIYEKDREAQYNPEAEIVTEAEWEEVYSILTQSVKKVYFAKWIEEEENDEITGFIDDYEFTLNTKEYWLPVVEPKEGQWPPLQKSGVPYIDPELIDEKQLPDVTLGKGRISASGARNLFFSRQQELADNFEVIKTAHEENDFNTMIEYALGETVPLEMSTWEDYFDDVYMRLNGSDQDEVLTATEEIAVNLKTNVDDFSTVYNVLLKSRKTDPSEQPDFDEWNNVYRIVTTIHKVNVVYTETDGWLDQEDTLLNPDDEDAFLTNHYWNLRKASLPKWRADKTIRIKWQVAMLNRSRPPYIDPDLMGPVDIERSGNEDMVWEIWNDRYDFIHDPEASPQGHMARIKTDRELNRDSTDPVYTLLEQFDRRIVSELLAMDDAITNANEFFTEINDDIESGKNVTRRLRQLNITYEEYRDLWRLRELCDAEATILESEWTMLYSILTAAHKRREYAFWRAEEQAYSYSSEVYNITLSQDFFRVPGPKPVEYPPKAEDELPLYLAQEVNKKYWQDKVKSRIEQEQTTLQGIQEAIRETEKVMLFKIRDALVMATGDYTPDSSALNLKAQWITDILQVDSKTLCCMDTTRISMAIECIQGLLWSIRTGQWDSSYINLKIYGSTFDMDWDWIGSYQSWRSAMFVNIYPENLLIPSLKRYQSAAFRNLVNATSDNGRLNPQQAIEAAKEYASYFSDISNLEIQATCMARDGLNAQTNGQAGNLTNQILHLFAINVKSQRVYWSRHNDNGLEGYKQSIWEELTAFEKAVEIVGAQALVDRSNDRYIVLLVKQLKKGREELSVARYNINKARWDEEANDLETVRPDQCRTIRIKMVQSLSDSLPPQVLMQAGLGWQTQVYTNRMNSDGTGWERDDWKMLFAWKLIIENDSWKSIVAAVEINKYLSVDGWQREFMVILQANAGVDKGKCYYRIFGPHDNGKLEYVATVNHFQGAVPYFNGSENDVYMYYKDGSNIYQQTRIRRVASTLETTAINGSGTGEALADKLKDLIFDISGEDISTMDIPKDQQIELILSGESIKETIGGRVTDVLAQVIDEVRNHASYDWNWNLINVIAGTFKSLVELGSDDIKGQTWTAIQESLSSVVKDSSYDIYWFMNSFIQGTSLLTMKRLLRTDLKETWASQDTWKSIAVKCADQYYYVNGIQVVNVQLSTSSKSNIWKYKVKPETSGRLIVDITKIDSREMSNPYIVSPLDIPNSLTKEDLQIRKVQIQSTMKLNNGIPAINYEYLKEAYYFVPMQIATVLSERGHFKEALDWFRTVYDYSQPDNDTVGAVNKRKIFYGLVREETYGRDFDRASDWLKDPLNPHAIASTRAFCYTKFTIMSIVKCMQAYADAEYTNDTAESVPRARRLYQTANELIGLLLPESNEEVLLNLDVTCEDRFLLPRWEELKRRISDITPLSAANNAVTALNSAVTGTLVDTLTEMKAAEAAVQGVIDTQSSTDSLSESIGIRVSNQASMASIALTNLAVDSAMVSITEQASNQFSNAVATVTGFSASAMQTSGASIPFLSGSSELTPSQPALVDTQMSSFLTSSAAAPSQEGNWVSALNGNPSQSVSEMVNASSGYLPNPDYRFKVPENPVFASLKFKSELNLFKIRTCRNIAGMKRQIDPYAAPTDTTSGMPVIGPGGQLVIPGNTKLEPTPYRYKVLIQRAKEMIGIAQQIESNFMATLEKLDAEKYSLMKAKQDLKLANATVRLQDLRVREAESGVTLAEKQVDRAKFQMDHFAKLISEGVSSLEAEAIGHLVSASDLQTSAHVLQQGTFVTYGILSATSVVDNTTNTANPYANADGAGVIEAGIKAVEAEAGALSTMAGVKSTLSSIASQRASYERRAQEWAFQKDTAGFDIGISKQQVKVAQDHVRVVGQERKIAEMQADFAQETLEFLSNKFTNQDLYRWISGVLEGVYSYFLQEATSMAALAQSQLAFERQQVPPPFIQGDYWSIPAAPGAASGANDDRRGLTGSARLLQDIYKLDQYAFTTDERKLQLSKTISLSSLAPMEFQRFRQTGEIVFGTPMAMFDRDFPGHYMRLIKKVKVNVIGLIPPFEGIKATLTSSGITRTVIGGDIFQETVIRRDPEVIALTSARDATGMFEMTAENEHFLKPFEFTGVDGLWEFRMEKAANLFEYDGIGDVMVTIDYEALNSFDYRAKVINQLGTDYQATMAYSFKDNFADTWYDLINMASEEGQTNISAIFNTFFNEYPANVGNPKITQLAMYFVMDKRQKFNPVVNLSFTHYSDEAWIIKPGVNGGEASAIDGLISTRKGNAASWLAIVDDSPVEGTWKLSISNPDTLKLFRDGAIRNIVFAVTYKGELPPYSI